MDEERAALGLPQCVGDKRRWGQAVSVAVVKALLARTAAGESLRSICRDPAMPAARTVCLWARERPAFAARLLEARRAAGGPFVGGRSTYCEATAQRLFDRIAGGEALSVVCRDADMPVAATVYKWRAERPEFARALALAFAVRAEELVEKGWEMCQAVTPETAIAARVQLWHLRWHVGKLAPKKYGAIKPVDVSAAAGPPALHVYTKKFVMGDQDEPGRWSEEPAQHLYSMVPVSDKARGGEPLPPPAAIREPRSTWGPNATGEPRGGAVECESDDEDDDPEGWT